MTEDEAVAWAAAIFRRNLDVLRASEAGILRFRAAALRARLERGEPAPPPPKAREIDNYDPLTADPRHHAIWTAWAHVLLDEGSPLPRSIAEYLLAVAVGGPPRMNPGERRCPKTARDLLVCHVMQKLADAMGLTGRQAAGMVVAATEAAGFRLELATVRAIWRRAGG